jgi:hypothetical protein
VPIILKYRSLSLLEPTGSVNACDVITLPVSIVKVSDGKLTGGYILVYHPIGHPVVGNTSNSQINRKQCRELVTTEFVCVCVQDLLFPLSPFSTPHPTLVNPINNRTP